MEHEASGQSGIIFAAIVVAFIVYITLKGELPIYAGFLLLPPKGSPTPNQSASGLTAAALSAAGL